MKKAQKLRVRKGKIVDDGFEKCLFFIFIFFIHLLIFFCPFPFQIASHDKNVKCKRNYELRCRELEKLNEEVRKGGR